MIARSGFIHKPEPSHEQFNEAVQDLPSGEPTAEQRVGSQQELAAIPEAILALPPRCREVFLLNRSEGMSFVKIASHLHISERSVEKHVANALMALRRRVG